MFDRIELRVFTDKRAACGDEVLPDAVYYALTFGDGFYFRFVGTIEDILDAFLFVLRTCFHDTGGYLFVVQSAGDTRAAGVVTFLLRHDVVVEIDVESDLFFSGMRPAVNVGLSVSRVGGAAQIKAIKKIAAPIRVELAQYRELAAFSQFGSELDADTTEKLAQGERIREILKQPQYKPLPVEYQVAIIYAATKKYLLDIPVEKILHFQDALLELIDTRYPEITGKITETQVIDEETEQKLIAAIQETKKEYLA